MDRERVLRKHAKELANGKVSTPTLASITAYADHLRFNKLPYAGGTFDQPAWLMEEMRVVHSEYVREQERLEKRAENRASRRRGR